MSTRLTETDPGPSGGTTGSGLEPLTPPLAESPAHADSSDVVTLDDVVVSFGGRRVLDGVSFSIGRGELVGLIGANGAGKTTLMRVILGLLHPDAGWVRRRAGRVGYVPQRVSIDADTPLRARDFVSLGVDGERLGVRLPSRARRARVDRMLEAVGAGGFADERVGQLSGGEQQRVLIAHALIGEPSLLVLDEPLANLDIRSGHEIVELVTRLKDELDIAVLLSAHDMNVLLPHIDRIVYLADGRAATGTVGAVVRSDVLSELYRYPVRVLDVDGTLVVMGGHDISLR
jgi:zinc/manganese transport system ATP-binding protein